MNFDEQYIYIIKERKFINTDEDVYKIGSSSSIIDSASHIRKGSNVYMIVKVNNASNLEKEIVGQLKKCKSLIHYSCIGDEYFQGDIITIINTVSQSIVLLRDEVSVEDESSSDESSCDASVQAEVDVEVSDEVGSDPVILISKYITDRKEELQEQVIDAVQFYKTVMSSAKFPCHFSYNKFAAILTKLRIYEQKMPYGPSFVFPPIPVRDESDILEE